MVSKDRVLGDGVALKMEEMLLLAKEVKQQLNKRQTLDLVMVEWEYFSNVLDRLLLLLFTLAVGFLTGGFLIFGSIMNSDLSLV